MDENFFKAAVPDRAEVLGIRLNDFSLGHLLLLARVHSPLLSGGLCRLDDLMQAVVICSQTWEENRREDLWLPLKLWLWRLRARKADVAAAAEKFRSYVATGSIEPITEAVTTTETPQRPPGAPWLLRLKQFLCVHRGLSESAAMDFPYGAAIWEWAAYWEERDGIKVENHEDREAKEWIVKMEALAAKGVPQLEAIEILRKEKEANGV